MRVKRYRLTIANAVPSTMGVEVRDLTGRSALPDGLEIVPGRGVMLLDVGEMQELWLPKGKYIVYGHGRYGRTRKNKLGVMFRRYYDVVVDAVTDPSVVFRVGMK